MSQTAAVYVPAPGAGAIARPASPPGTATAQIAGQVRVIGDGEQVQAVPVCLNDELNRIGRAGDVRAVPGAQPDAEQYIAIWHQESPSSWPGSW
jgi:hypothetical protein